MGTKLEKIHTDIAEKIPHLDKAAAGWNKINLVALTIVACTGMAKAYWDLVQDKTKKKKKDKEED